jgi:hypothetical protein
MMRLFLLGVVSLVTALHVGIMFFSAGPDNILLKQYRFPLAVYTNRVFFQNWQFFAPKPIDHDLYLIARVRRGARVGPWYDVSNGLIERVHANRFSRDEIVLLAVSNAVIDVENEFLPPRVHLSPEFLRDNFDYRLLTRTAASAIAFAERRTDWDAVQIAIVRQDMPNFAHRRQQQLPRARKAIVVPWQPFPADVTTLGWI